MKSLFLFGAILVYDPTLHLPTTIGLTLDRGANHNGRIVRTKTNAPESLRNVASRLNIQSEDERRATMEMLRRLSKSAGPDQLPQILTEILVTSSDKDVLATAASILKDLATSGNLRREDTAIEALERIASKNDLASGILRELPQRFIVHISFTGFRKTSENDPGASELVNPKRTILAKENESGRIRLLYGDARQGLLIVDGVIEPNSPPETWVQVGQWLEICVQPDANDRLILTATLTSSSLNQALLALEESEWRKEISLVRKVVTPGAPTQIIWKIGSDNTAPSVTEIMIQPVRPCERLEEIVIEDSPIRDLSTARNATLTNVRKVLPPSGKK